MSIDIITRKIGKKHDSFVKWKLEKGFFDDYYKKISDSYYDMKSGSVIIGVVLAYTIGTTGYFHDSFFPASGTPNGILTIFFCLSILLVAAISGFIVSKKINKRINEDMQKIIDNSQLYEICYQATSSDFDSLPIDLEMRNLLKITLSHDEWKALHFHTKNKINYGNLKEFINYYLEKQINIDDIESSQYIVEIGPLYSKN